MAEGAIPPNFDAEDSQDIMYSFAMLVLSVLLVGAKDPTVATIIHTLFRNTPTITATGATGYYAAQYAIRRSKDRRKIKRRAARAEAQAAAAAAKDQ